ncbi:hypothetical protein EUGRSUZ_F00235 [Eucalyptus grandis]|uniref:Uncharacterized protein n=2 Tax=Eucalyptus grandis TaxID=71139 RepID=A0ACC3KA15_EUCGR|nr:hypothetical protein EUGRSUZ_F00235 [Eucalyptus grandis]
MYEHQRVKIRNAIEQPVASANKQRRPLLVGNNPCLGESSLLLIFLVHGDHASPTGWHPPHEPKFDANKDNRISKEELQDIIRSYGKWFSGWKSKQALSRADANGDGFIDDKEMINLVEFAKKQLGVTVVAN